MTQAGNGAITAVVQLVKTALKGKEDKLPTGIISIWYGAANAVPSGWALCNGENGTPDLRGKFVLGCSDEYAVGNTGGESEHTLTVAELPEHNHYAGTKTGRLFTLGTSSGDFIVTSSQSGADNVSGGDAGSGKAHNNMPPYYVLAYIMKL